MFVLAIVWGNGSRTQYGATLYVGIDMIVSGTAVQPVVYWGLDAGHSLQVSNASLTVTGSVSHTATVALHGSGADAKYLWDNTFSVQAQYGRAVTGSVTATLSGYGASSTVTGYYSVDPLPYERAATPSNCSAWFDSDTQATVAWTVSAPVSAPIHHFNFAQTINNQAYTYTSIPGDLRSYTVTGLPADSSISWAVSSLGEGGNSDFAYSNTLYTTPAVPTGFKAERDGMNIVLSWVNPAKHARTVEVWDGNTKIGETTSNTYTVVAPDPQKKHEWWVRTSISGRFSKWAGPLSIILLQAPKAPTGLTPDGQYAPINEPVRLSWQHNPSDTTEQTKYEIRYRKDGKGAWTTIPASTSANYWHEASFGAEVGFVEWQVRTWGQDTAKPSPWSNSAVINFVARPQVTGLTPANGSKVNNSVTDGRITASIEGFGWRVTLKDGDKTVYERSGYTGANNASFTLDRLENGKTYKLVAVASGRVESLPFEVSFTVAYEPPPVPKVLQEWSAGDGVLSHMVTPIDGAVKAAVFELWDVTAVPARLVNSVKASGLTPVVLADRLAHVGGGQVFEIRAIAENGAASFLRLPASVPCPVQAFYVSWGQALEQCLRIIYNPSLELGVSRDVSVLELTGSPLPVVVYGASCYRVQKVSGLLVGEDLNTPNGDTQMKAAVNSLAAATTPVWLRSPKLEATKGYIEGLSLGWSNYGPWQISFTHNQAEE